MNGYKLSAIVEICKKIYSFYVSMMNMMYEHHIIFMSTVYVHFKAYQVSVSSVKVFIFFQCDLHQDSILKMLLVVFCIAAPHRRYKGHIRLLHQHVCTVKETKSGSIM